MKNIVPALVVALALAASASAQTIAQWTFETSVPTTAGPLAPEIGLGSAIGFHASGSTVYSNPAGNGSLESWSSNFWSTGDYYQFQVSSLGLEDISISWDQMRSSTGPANFDLSWSTDGVAFTAIQSYDVAVTFGTFSQSFAAVSGADNQTDLYFRLIQTSATGATSGTNRVDNVTISGVTAIPEPSTYAVIMGVLTLGVVLYRRRQKA